MWLSGHDTGVGIEGRCSNQGVELKVYDGTLVDHGFGVVTADVLRNHMYTVDLLFPAQSNPRPYDDPILYSPVGTGKKHGHCVGQREVRSEWTKESLDGLGMSW